jgi:drug/metabolite transporter (DMT)-like permease
LTRGGWLRLAALGLTFYAVTQGAQYLSLFYLPAVHVSLLLSFSAVVVALLGIAFLEERPTATQWGGTLLYLAGVLIFFYPLMLPAGSAVGLLIASLGVVANAVSSILGRQINRARDLEPLGVTVVSMGIGGPLLLLVGIAAHGLPRLEPLGWLLVAWLALVNSALAFTLWNHTLRTLSAVESSIINNTMLFQIALLAWVFLGEGLAARQIAGTMVAGAGTLIVQLSGRSSIATRRCPPSRRAHSAADNQS